MEELRTEARRQRTREGSLRAWVRDRSLGIVFVSVFLTTWLGQLFFEWQVYAHDEREHGSTASLWSGGF